MSQVDVYPSPDIPTQSSTHSNGSFAQVLIVLAVIFVLVIVSVVLGRICNRRYSKGDRPSGKAGKKEKGKKSKQKESKFHHHNQPAGGEGGGTDIEFGFDKRFASAKVASNNGDHFNFKAPKMPLPHHHNGGGGGGGHGHGGQTKGHAVRFADDHHIEFRTGA